MVFPFPMLSRYVVPDMPSADELLPWLRRIDARRWYSNFGPLTTEFEERMAALFQTPDAGMGTPLAVSTLASCYHALEIGLRTLHMPPGANVLVPAVTFPACPLAVQNAGARAVLADIDPVTWQLTPETARRAAEKISLQAVMPVALYGVPVPTPAWDLFTEETGIPVVIDAAAAMDAQAIPRHGLAAFSLHATKPFSVGEGGLLVCRDKDRIEEARRMSNFGTHLRIAERSGCNAKMSEYHAAVGLAQFARWDDAKARRRQVYGSLRDAVEAACPDAVFQEGIEHAIVSTVMLRVEGVRGTAMVEAFEARGVAAHRMYLPPLYRHPYFAGLPVANGEGVFAPGDAAITTKAALMEGCELMLHEVFGVPFHAFLGDADIERLGALLSDIVTGLRPARAAARRMRPR